MASLLTLRLEVDLHRRFEEQNNRFLAGFDARPYPVVCGADGIWRPGVFFAN